MNKYYKYFKEMLFIIGKDRKKLIILFFLFITAPLIDVIGIGLIGPYMQLLLFPENFNDTYVYNYLTKYQILDDPYKNVLLVSSIILLVIFISKSFLAIFLNHSTVKILMYYLVEVRKKLINSYKKINYLDYLQLNSSKYIEITTGLSSIFISHCLGAYLRLFSETLVAIFFLLLLIYTNWKLLLVLIAIILPVLLIYDYLFKNTLIFYGRKKSLGKQKIIKGVKELFDGFKLNLIFNSFNYFENKIIEGANDIRKGEIISKLITFSPRHILEFLFIFVIIISVIFLSLNETNFLLYIPSFTVFAIASIRIVPSIINIVNIFTSINEGRYATENIYSELKKNREKNYVIKNNSIKQHINNFEKLELKNVSFRYPGSKDFTLRKINIDIIKNHTIGIIGESGSGKTTLIDVVLGLLPISDGEILINNKNLNDFNLSSWHNKISYLTQDSFLIDDTIEKNISLDSKEVDIENLKKINQSLKKSHLSDFIDQLPEGTKTKLGERGVRISGGQKQRIVLARSFYFNKEILIMDESTSSLDIDTEKEIIREIKNIKGKITIIIIAHRQSTIEYCDQIYRISKNSINKER